MKLERFGRSSMAEPVQIVKSLVGRFRSAQGCRLVFPNLALSVRPIASLALFGRGATGLNRKFRMKRVVAP